jgi:hypothetical protein
LIDTRATGCINQLSTELLEEHLGFMEEDGFEASHDLLGRLQVNDMQT